MKDLATPKVSGGRGKDSAEDAMAAGVYGVEGELLLTIPPVAGISGVKWEVLPKIPRLQRSSPLP